MAEDNVLKVLTGVFQEVFDDDTIKLTPETTADDIDSWDSMNHIRLILTIERKFNLRLPSSKIGHLKNVGDLIELIRKYL